MQYQHDADVVMDLVWANKILANEGILDAFGHVSARSVENPDEFLISRARAPQLVDSRDILRMTVNNEVVTQTQFTPYKESVIHAAIYQQRSDVMAVVHFHAYPLIPFCATGIEPRPIHHVAGMFWDGIAWYEEFDVSDGTLIISAKSGARLARALGNKRGLLIKNHGAVVVGESIRHAVMGAIYLTYNADSLQKALAVGGVRYMSRELARAAAEIMFSPVAIDRAWEYWQRRVPREWLKSET